MNINTDCLYNILCYDYSIIYNLKKVSKGFNYDIINNVYKIKYTVRKESNTCIIKLKNGRLSCKISIANLYALRINRYITIIIFDTKYEYNISIYTSTYESNIYPIEYIHRTYKNIIYKQVAYFYDYIFILDKYDYLYSKCNVLQNIDRKFMCFMYYHTYIRKIAATKHLSIKNNIKKILLKKLRKAMNQH